MKFKIIFHQYVSPYRPYPPKKTLRNQGNVHQVSAVTSVTWTSVKCVYSMELEDGPPGRSRRSRIFGKHLFFSGSKAVELWECADEKTLDPKKLTAKAPKNRWKLQVFGISKPSRGLFSFSGAKTAKTLVSGRVKSMYRRDCVGVHKDRKAWISSGERSHLSAIHLASIVEVRQTNILLGRLFPLAEGFFFVKCLQDLS